MLIKSQFWLPLRSFDSFLGIQCRRGIFCFQHFTERNTSAMIHWSFFANDNEPSDNNKKDVELEKNVLIINEKNFIYDPRVATVESLRNGLGYSFADIKKFKLDFVFKMDMFLMLCGLLGVARPRKNIPEMKKTPERAEKTSFSDFGATKRLRVK